MNRYRVHANGQDISYFRTGGDKPPLLLIHGYTDGAIVWQSLIERLQPDYDVIAYDSRGHGETSRIGSPYTLLDLADDCNAFINALALAPARLIGHSMGSATAFFTATRYPNSVKWVVLEDPPFYEVPPLNARNFQEWRDGTQMLQQAPREVVLGYYRNEYVGWGETDLQTRVDARRALDLAIFDQMDWFSAPTWQSEIAKIACAGLLLTGEETLGGLVSPTIATAMQAQWQSLTHVHIAGVGHHVRCENPQAYWNALTHFIHTQETA